jgi:hypothetical protein
MVLFLVSVSVSLLVVLSVALMYWVSAVVFGWVSLVVVCLLCVLLFCVSGVVMLGSGLAGGTGWLALRRFLVGVSFVVLIGVYVTFAGTDWVCVTGAWWLFCEVFVCVRGLAGVVGVIMMSTGEWVMVVF